MSSTDPLSPHAEAQTDRGALEALVIDNAELEQLEALLDQFNIFEAIGAVRQELRHSDFLAFLLDPRQNHGLADAFLKRFLQRALRSANGDSVPVSLVDLDVWDLDQTTVLREWQDIDILLLDDEHRLAVIIENKIGTTEHSNQLRRYEDIVRHHYPAWKVLGIYLTPSGEDPSDNAYVPLSYVAVCEIIEALLKSRSSTLGVDVHTLMTHYAQMLRRYIVSESEIANLCRRIYQRHKRALDLIYEYRPDRQAALRDFLEELVKETPSMTLDYATKNYIDFCPKNWDLPVLRCGSGWTRSGRMLLFEFENLPDSVKLKLMIGPGPEETRRKLLAVAQANEPPFKSAFKGLNQKWNTIYVRSLLTAKSLEDAQLESMEEDIRRHWAKFLETDLVEMDKVIKQEAWLAQSADAGSSAPAMGSGAS